jgi:hypothetical protein
MWSFFSCSFFRCSKMVMFGRGLKGCIRPRNVADEMTEAAGYGVE